MTHGCKKYSFIALLLSVFILLHFSCAFCESNNICPQNQMQSMQVAESGNEIVGSSANILRIFSIVADVVSIVSALVSFCVMVSVKKYRKALIRRQVQAVVVKDLNDIIVDIEIYAKKQGRPIPESISYRVRSTVTAIHEGFDIQNIPQLTKFFDKLKECSSVTSENVTEISMCLRVVQGGLLV